MDKFNEGEAYRLIFKIDGDYIDVFLHNETTKLCTLINVDKYFLEALDIIIKGEKADLSKVHFPHRADGSMDYPLPVSKPDAIIAEEAENAENVADSNDDKNQASPLPLWAWFAIIGIAVAVSGGIAVFVVKRKK